MTLTALMSDKRQARLFHRWLKKGLPIVKQAAKAVSDYLLMTSIAVMAYPTRSFSCIR